MKKHLTTVPVRSVCFAAVLGILSFLAKGQDTPTDTLIIEAQDTVLMKSQATRFNPRKALLFAAVVPGLGQVYNKKYWKLPLVYGGFAVLGWNVRLFHNQWQDYRGQLFYNLEHGLISDNQENPFTGLTTKQLRSVEGRARRERDFWIIMLGAMYLLQMVDAHVDAHLKEFDVNPNLRVSVEPTIEKNAVLGKQTGLSLTVKF